MSHFVIQGGRTLSGSIKPQGAKNEALQVLSAVLLSCEWVELSNLADIGDVRHLLALLKLLGVEQEQGETPNSLRLCAKTLSEDALHSDDFHEGVGRLRGSVMLLAPLLYRFGRVSFSSPGGDRIGRRRLDTHIKGLQALGVSCEYDRSQGRYTLWLSEDRFKPAKVLLDEASVTGTANVMMAAACASGETTIYHAACEPYVQQLGRFLIEMGVSIDGLGTNCIRVTGTKGGFSGAFHTFQSDIIEVGSFISLAALTASELRIESPNLPHLGMIVQMFDRLGVSLTVDGEDLVVPAQKHYKIRSFMDGSIMTIYDGIWPALSPDMISIGIVTALQADGEVLFHQRMFESRLFFVDKLISMGGRVILCDPHRVAIMGLGRKQPLNGIRMVSPDIRAGVALLIAALSAEGESIIENIHQIDRGYERIESRLNALGASIRREE